MEILSTILSIVAIAVESIAFSYMICTISCIICKDIANKSIKQILINSIVIFVTYLATHAISLYLPEYTWLKSLLCVVSFTLALKFIVKIGILPAFFSTILTVPITAVVELLVVVIIKAFGFIPLELMSNPNYNSIILVVLSAFYVGVTYLVFKMYKSAKQSSTSIKEISKYILPQFITIIICLIPSMALLIKNYFEYSIAFIIINIIQLLVVSMVSMYNIQNVIKQKNTEMQLENTIIHNQTLMKVNEGVRGFKHDMGNIVQAILGYIALNDQEGAKKFCQNLVIGFNDINVLSILSPKVINEPAVYGVVVNKILIARENNMELSLDITADIAKINFPKFELSRILGILIDNAIEAGLNTEAKKLILTIHTSKDELYDEIIISNSIKDTNIPLDKIFKKDYSSKANPSGFGLYEVEQTFNKYTQGVISTKIDNENMLFTQKIKIFK